jgi:hypothetical protein
MDAKIAIMSPVRAIIAVEEFEVLPEVGLADSCRNPCGFAVKVAVNKRKKTS